MMALKSEIDGPKGHEVSCMKAIEDVTEIPFAVRLIFMELGAQDFLKFFEVTDL